MAWDTGSKTVHGITYTHDSSYTLPKGTPYYSSVDGSSGYDTLDEAKTVWYYGYNDTTYSGYSESQYARYYFCASEGGSPGGSGGWKYVKEADLPYATYTVSYNANGGSGAPNSQTKTWGTNLTLSSTKPTRSGYAFQGWGTSTTDTTVDYAAGGTYTANAGDTLYAIWKKTIELSYDAGEGSGAPSKQSASVYNATTSYKFTISSTTPKRTGYTFLGWSTSDSATSASYSAGGSITLSSSDTLYAVWTENVLTVIYYGNKADGCKYKGNVVSIDSSNEASEILVDGVALSSKFYYDTAATTGLADMQNSSYLYLTRTGWSSLGKWNTASDGTGKEVGEKEVFDTGQELAVALGTTLASSDKTVYVYAQWEENTITAYYHSNGATSAFSGAKNPVDGTGTDDAIVREYSWTYSSGDLAQGLHNYSTEGSTTYLAKKRYNPIGYWGTVPDMNIKDYKDDEDGVIENDYGIAVSEDKSFDSGQALAEAFGLSLETSSQEIDIYAQWKLAASRVTVYGADGNANEGAAYIYDSGGTKHCAIITYYDSNGDAWVVV